jgi:hypothetical protein
MGSNVIFIDSNLSEIDFISQWAQKTVLTVIIDEMAGALAVGCPESEDERTILPARPHDLRCYLAFIKKVEPTPDLLDLDFPEKIVYMPEQFFLCPEMPG